MLCTMLHPLRSSWKIGVIHQFIAAIPSFDILVETNLRKWIALAFCKKYIGFEDNL